MRSLLAWMFLSGSGFCLDAWAAKKEPVLPRQREAVQCEQIRPPDFDGDGVPDLACITRRGNEEPQWVTVVLSSARAGAPPALDVPLLHCPNCQGLMPNVFELEVFSPDPGAKGAPPSAGSLHVSETGGSRSFWTHDYEFEQSGLRFALSSERHGISDRLIEAGVRVSIDHAPGKTDSVRHASPEDPAKKQGVEFLDIHALPRKGAITVDGRPAEPAWNRAPRQLVRPLDYTTFEKTPLESEKDLAFTLRALWDERSLYLLIEVTDDSVVLAPAGKNGVRYDHLELWAYSGLESWEGDYSPRMEPAPEESVQFGLVPLQGGHQVQVLRWYPDEQEEAQVDAAYLLTPAGYTVEVRLPLERFKVLDSNTLTPDPLNSRRGFINLTVMASDADSRAAPRQESMIATSRLEHRGAPFELGLLHLMKSALPDVWKH